MSQKHPVIIPVTGKQVDVKVFLNTLKGDPEPIDLLTTLEWIGSWSVCGKNPIARDEGSCYWNSADVGKRVEDINGSIKLVNKMALHRNKKRYIDGI